MLDLNKSDFLDCANAFVFSTTATKNYFFLLLHSKPLPAVDGVFF